MFNIFFGTLKQIIRETEFLEKIFFFLIVGKTFIHCFQTFIKIHQKLNEITKNLQKCWMEICSKCYQIMTSEKIGFAVFFLSMFQQIFEFLYYTSFYLCLKSEQNKNFESIVQNIDYPGFIYWPCIHIYIYPIILTQEVCI